MFRKEKRLTSHERDFIRAPKGKAFPTIFALSQQARRAGGRWAKVAAILKTLDIGRYDDKNGLNKVRTESMLLGRMLGQRTTKTTEQFGGDEGGWHLVRSDGLG